MIKITIIILTFIQFNCFGKQIIQLGIENIDYYPLYATFESADKKSKEYDGLSFDILKLFNQSQNEFEIVFNPLPIKKLYFEYLKKNSKLDAKFPDNPLWADKIKKETNAKIYYSEPILNFTDGAFVLQKNKNLDINHVKIIGTISGFSPIGYQEKINKGKIKLVEFNDINSLIKKLLSNNVNLIYINKFIGKCKAKNFNKDKEIVFSNKLPQASGEYYLSSINNFKFISLFNDFLKKKQDHIKKIEKAYTEFMCNLDN